MKHTKKMMLIPEVEYLALVNMLKGKDEVGYEKAHKDVEIGKVLEDKKLDELVKSKKIDWLLKQKQSLKKEMDKPQRIEIDKDQLNNIFENISKYLGVTSQVPFRTQKPPAKAQQQPTIDLEPEIAQKEVTKKPIRTRRIKSTPINGAESEPEPSTSHAENLDYIIHPKYKKDFIKILKQNSNNLKIQKSGEIKDKNDVIVEGSKLDDIMSYLTGELEHKPVGTDILLNRLKDKSYWKTALNWADWHRQRGEGKGRRSGLLNLTLYKQTRGLVRHKPKLTSKFKPTMWAKIQ